jgi:hypothetical protein
MRARWLRDHGLGDGDAAAAAQRCSAAAVFETVAEMYCYEQEVGLDSGHASYHRHATVSKCFQPLRKAPRTRTTLRHEGHDEDLIRWVSL